MIASEEFFFENVWHLIYFFSCCWFFPFSNWFLSFFVRRVISLVSNIRLENLEKKWPDKECVKLSGGPDFESREFSAPWIKIDSTKSMKQLYDLTF